MLRNEDHSRQVEDHSIGNLQFTNHITKCNGGNMNRNRRRAERKVNKKKSREIKKGGNLKREEIKTELRNVWDNS